MKGIKVKVKCHTCGEPRTMAMCAERGMMNCCRCTKCNNWFFIRNVEGKLEVTKR